MKNILTVDCEDWFHTEVSQKYLRGRSEVMLEDRINENVNVLLKEFRGYKARATFFVLGSVAEKFPDLIRRIEEDGHRIGAHGYAHTSAFLRTAAEFDKDIEKVTRLLGRLASRPVLSFRAPNWSIGYRNFWAIEILKKYGYRYDSSFKRAFHIKKRIAAEQPQLIEIPRSGKMLWHFQIPFGGAFLRLYPLNLMLHLMREMNQGGSPFMVYVHPWEVDRAIPFIETSWADKVIQYQGISENLEKIKAVLASFEFVSIEEFFEEKGMDFMSLNRFCFFI